MYEEDILYNKFLPILKRGLFANIMSFQRVILVEN